MKYVLFGIFAHPDDEAFGPSGTLYAAAHTGTDVHLICATDGASGVNIDDHDDLGARRITEWNASAAAIGATSTHHMGYHDGQLCNNLFHNIAAEVELFVITTLAGYSEPVEARFITFEHGGISGHIDHIVMCMVTRYVHLRLCNATPDGATIGWLRYFCLPAAMVPRPHTNFVYMPKGYEAAQITHTEDVSALLDTKIAIMKLHESQRSDAETILSMAGDMLGYENFIEESTHSA